MKSEKSKRTTKKKVVKIKSGQESGVNMGTKTTIIFGCLITVMVLSVGYELGQAQSGPGSLNIGTVSIGRVFSEC